MIKRFFIKHRGTVRDFFWRNIQTFGKKFYFLLVFFYSAKILEPADFGTLNYFLAIVGLLVVFCDFGFSVSASKYVAEYKATDPDRLRKTFTSVSVVILAIASLISIALISIGGYLFGDNLKYALLLIPFLFLAPLTAILDGLYRGTRRFRQLSIINIIAICTSMAIALPLIKTYALVGTILSINSLYIFLTLGMTFFSKNISFSVDRNITKEVSRYAVYIGLASLAYYMYTRVDILILKQFGYVTEIGYYAIVNSLFGIILIPSTMLGQVIAPRTSTKSALGEFVDIKRKFTRSIIPSLTISLPLSILLFFLLPAAIKMVLPKYYTPNFIRIFGIMMILLPFKLWSVFTVNGFITPGGFAKIITVATFIGGILNILFDYLLIWLMGFIGVFITTLVVHSLTIVVVNTLFFLKIRKLAASVDSNKP
ncbi:MAG: oligosaccharide flippase family protein [Candidatus Omnitrophica bacterium]|nr:oligosaccharide flippase family protein [Candidatus Omnitrophota bacterium]